MVPSGLNHAYLRFSCISLKFCFLSHKDYFLSIFYFVDGKNPYRFYLFFTVSVRWSSSFFFSHLEINQFFPTFSFPKTYYHSLILMLVCLFMVTVNLLCCKFFSLEWNGFSSLNSKLSLFVQYLLKLYFTDMTGS